MKADLKNTFRLVGWSFLFIMVILLIMSAVETKRVSRVESLIINIQPLPDGNSLLEEEDILKTLDRSFGVPLTDMKVGGLDVGRVERVLIDDPFVLDAEVFMDGNNQLNIDLTQREPLLRIIDKNGLNYYLDKEGRKLPLSKHYAARVLVATGNIPPHVPDFQQKENHMLYKLFSLTHLILNDPFYKPLIEQVHINNKGEFLMIPKIGKQEIILGDVTDAAEKLERLKIFYNQGMPFEGWHKFKTLDVRFKGQVVCKKV